MEHNPYAEAIGRESVAKARLLKAASQKNARAKKTGTTTLNDATTNVTNSGNNGGPSPEDVAAAGGGSDDDDDPTGMGGVMGTTIVEQW